MPTGRVKDPQGHQSGAYDFGYLERNDLGWPDANGQPTEGPKVIPYLNVDKENKREHDYSDVNKTEVIFNSRKAHIIYRGRILGSIGIALTEAQLLELKE